MVFYYPLSLGTRRKSTRRKPLRGADSSEYNLQKYDSWSAADEYVEYPETTILQEIKNRSNIEKKFWVILGEPGAGKSSLLESWFQQWIERSSFIQYGMTVPILVRMKHIDHGECQNNDSENRADYFWRFGLDARAQISSDLTERIYQSSKVRMFNPVWLLDGLDELPDSLLNKVFYEKLCTLPGMKIISCRKAVYEKMIRPDIETYKANEYEILKLKPAQQKEFLTGWIKDHRAATKLYDRLKGNAQLSSLASNPLLLSLLAEIGTKLELPTNRAEFYEQAVQTIWHRKLTTPPQTGNAIKERDDALSQLASSVKLGEEIPQRNLKVSDNLYNDLKKSGLISINEKRGKIDFFHLAFREYYLAKSWVKDPQEKLQTYWHDVRYEETLGFLLSELFSENRHHEMEETVRGWIEEVEQKHKENPSILWEIGRSPLRTILHILRRSAIPMDQWETMQTFLWDKIRHSPLRTQAAVHDPGMPGFILAALAKDSDDWIRQAVARNPSATPEILSLLATEDQNDLVRYAVTQNPSVLLEDL